jgi:putative membrane protein
MKFQELQKKFQNKYAIRMLAGVLVVAMMGGSFAAGYVRGNTEQAVTVEAAEKSELEEKIGDLVNQTNSVDDTTKDETVYVIADSKGNAGKVIVEEWLKNKDGSATIEDKSDLDDITNVKGDETFTQNGENLTWQANGSDIYYEGTSDKEVPVSETVTYYLDGEEIEPEELAGKSGKVTIRFDYENHEKTVVTKDGEDYEVYVPFTVLTGMVVDDSFTNIEVTNGKVISDGKNNIVVGFAMPGLKESLESDESDFDSDIEFPDHVEISADVEDFSLEMTATIAMSGLLSDLSLGDMDLSSLEDSINELSDGSEQLEDGSKQIKDGLSTLKESMETFTSGASDLKDGINDYTDGAKQINDGLSTLNSSVGTLSSGATTLDASAKTIAEGVKKLDTALNTEMTDAEKTAAKKQVDAQFSENSTAYKLIYQAAKSNFTSTMTSDATVSQIQTGISGVGLTSDGVVAALAEYYATNGFTDPTSGTSYSASKCKEKVPGTDTTYAAYFASTVLKGALAQGIASGIADGGADAVGKSVTSACKTAAESAAIQGAESAKKTIAAQIEAVDKTSGYSLVTGTSALSSGISTLAAGVPELVSGVSQLAEGSKTLVSNNEKLKSGASQLADGAVKIAEGVDKLDDGAGDLYDGMVTFNEEGISKLVDAFNGDAKDLLNRIDAVITAGENYDTFTGLTEDQVGSVKFIIKTDAVKAEEE